MTDAHPEALAEASAALRIAFVPGVTLGKWSRVWEQRYPDAVLGVTPIDEVQQVTVLHNGDSDVSFVRLPIDRDGLNAIPLYREVAVVVVAKDSAIAAFEEVAVEDLAGEHLLQHPDAVPEWRDIADEVRDGTRVEVPAMSYKDAIEVVASGAGIVIVPKSVARLFDRKDVVHRPVVDVGETQVALAWRSDASGEVAARIEQFIGVVRGRSERSTRDADAVAAEKDAAARRAAEKRAASRKATEESRARKQAARKQVARSGSGKGRGRKKR